VLAAAYSGHPDLYTLATVDQGPPLIHLASPLAETVLVSWARPFSSTVAPTGAPGNDRRSLSWSALLDWPGRPSHGFDGQPLTLIVAVPRCGAFTARRPRSGVAA